MNMTECEKIREEMVLWLSGEMDGSNVRDHIQHCDSCREELRQLRELMKDVAAAERENEATMASIHWERTARSVARGAMTSSRISAGKTLLHRARFPLAAALFGLGLLTGYLFFRGGGAVTMPMATPVQLAESIRIVETEMDRREIVEFLGRTRLLLAEFNQPSLSEDERQALSENSGRLLREYRYLAQNLSGSRLQAARSVLEKLSWLLTEVAGESIPSAERIEEMRGFMERERLLLKVRLVERELAVPAREV